MADSTKKYVRKVSSSYSKFLVPILGKGRFHDELIDGLEGVLLAAQMPDAIPKPLLQSKIRFSEIERPHGTRIANAFMRKGIQTYAQLLDYMRKIEPHLSLAYGRRLEEFGPKCEKVLLKHLMENGIDISFYLDGR